MSSALFNWKRFWCPREGGIDLSDGGYLVDPTTPWGAIHSPSLRSFEDLAEFHALVLLGEPGLGKSSALTSEQIRLEQTSRLSDTLVKHVDLRAYGNEQLLLSKVFGDPTLQKWQGGEGRLILQLDSLDESLLRIDNIAALIADELLRLPTHRMSLRIACRTARWPGNILEQCFSEIWSPTKVGVFELAPLRRKDVREAASQRGFDADTFLGAVWDTRAVPFAIKPLTLNMLFNLWERHGHLPESITELYRQGCLALCEEQSPSRRDARRVGRLNPTMRLEVAGHIAAVTMLANRYAIWTGLESAEKPAEDVCIGELVGGTVGNPEQQLSIDESALHETLDTGLFSSRGAFRLGWSHQSYAEFLTAYYLKCRSVPAESILKLLTHPRGGLVPQLEEVTSWTATLDPEARRALLKQSPLTLLRSDTWSWGSEERAELVSAVLEALESGRAHDMNIGLRSYYRCLQHSNLATQLRHYITDKSKNVIVRRAALEIAGACAVLDLENDVLSVALDTAEDEHIRATSVLALQTCGTTISHPAIRSLAEGKCGPDESDEIKGSALQLLWPNYISADDLFELLTTPKRTNLFGHYAGFLTYRLVPGLTAASIPVALNWAVKEAGKEESNFYVNSLIDSILLKAWEHVEMPTVCAGFARVALARLRSWHGLVSGFSEDENQLHNLMRERADRRRLVLRSALLGESRQFDRHALHHAGILVPADLPWLIEMLADTQGDSTEAAVVEAIWIVFDASKQDHFAMIYAAASRSDVLSDRFSSLLRPVELNSDLARKLRAEHESVLQIKSIQVTPGLDPPPSARVTAALFACENGNLDAWVQLNAELTLEPTSRHYRIELEHDLTTYHGWKVADEETRNRIIAAAKMFLLRGHPATTDWLGTNKIDFRALAAYRALFLLRKVNRAEYALLPHEVWRRWAPVVVAIPRDTMSEAAKLHDEITAEACGAAPCEFVSTVKLLMESEVRRATDLSQGPREQTGGLHVISHLGGCWQNAELIEMMSKFLKYGDMLPEQFGSLLDKLLDYRVVDARKFAISRFYPDVPQAHADRERALVAACSVAKHCAEQAWGAIWAAVLKDEPFGKELFLRLARERSLDKPFYIGLDEEEIANTFVWLSRMFPHAEDPEHEEAYFASPRDSMKFLRDGMLRHLVQSGTIQSVEALEQAVRELPHLEWLRFQLNEAEEHMRQFTWVPLTPTEIIKLIRNKNARLVETPNDLLDVICSSLRRYENETLHGQQGSLRLFWDKQGNTGVFRPVDENTISDHVRNALQQGLSERGVVVNREVEISRMPGASLGQRTDIKVDAIRKNDRIAGYDIITAIVETKGCWNKRLEVAMKEQLIDDYLKKTGAPCGIYLVAWFNKGKWDPSDYRRTDAPDWSVEEAQKVFDDQATAETVPGRTIRSVVLNYGL